MGTHSAAFGFNFDSFVAPLAVAGAATVAVVESAAKPEPAEACEGLTECADVQAAAADSS